MFPTSWESPVNVYVVPPIVAVSVSLLPMLRLADAASPMFRRKFGRLPLYVPDGGLTRCAVKLPFFAGEPELVHVPDIVLPLSVPVALRPS